MTATFAEVWMPRLSIAMIGFVCVISTAAGQGAGALYKDQQIRMVVGAGAGGGYDAYMKPLSIGFSSSPAFRMR
jgi:tripartite-type tricarboxylate transporter receptor subunit TctC